MDCGIEIDCVNPKMKDENTSEQAWDSVWKNNNNFVPTKYPKQQNKSDWQYSAKGQNLYRTPKSKGNKSLLSSKLHESKVLEEGAVGKTIALSPSLIPSSSEVILPKNSHIQIRDISSVRDAMNSHSKDIQYQDGNVKTSRNFTPLFVNQRLRPISFKRTSKKLKTSCKSTRNKSKFGRK
ncbi:unnamed protein product [Moneuplotes crassus]|uniref:Uncharacterized protein n=1 Tax=Euplotes crassus TaxID=5936 RepID=A0AAD1U0T9_EUPCR|nr:unnamed protein product [Moneuplotes crassus]